TCLAAELPCFRFFFFSSRRRHTRFSRDWSSDVCSSDLFPFIRKQGMQLSSKMRFVAAQFEALLDDELWRRSAEHANRMARRLGRSEERRVGKEGRARWAPAQ